jgi:hypothetical protein
MLVLSRQRSETIMIGDDIEVTVVDIRGDKVRWESPRRARSASIARRCTTRSAGRIAPPHRSSRKTCPNWESINPKTPGQGTLPSGGLPASQSNKTQPDS